MMKMSPFSGLCHQPQGFCRGPQSWNVHASAICIKGRPVIATGPAGSGKTSLCQSLLQRFAPHSHWIADDRLEISVSPDSVSPNSVSLERLAIAPTAALDGWVGDPFDGPVRVEGMRSVAIHPGEIIWCDLGGAVSTQDVTYNDRCMVCFGRPIRLLNLGRRPTTAMVLRAFDPWLPIEPLIASSDTGQSRMRVTN